MMEYNRLPYGITEIILKIKVLHLEMRREHSNLAKNKKNMN